jgi:hypothetical protein
VGTFAVEGRQRAGRAEEDPHRVRVVLEAVDELLDVLVDDGVRRDVTLPLRPGVRTGEFAEEQQVRHLEEGAVLGELLDGIPTILEDAPIAVDERNGAAATGRVEECRVVGHQAEVVGPGLDGPQFRRCDGAVLDGKLVLEPRAIVGDAERVLRHTWLLCDVRRATCDVRRARARRGLAGFP